MSSLIWRKRRFPSLEGGYPPPPALLKALLGAGFTKSVRKILMSKSLEVKILKTGDLVPRRWGWLRSVWLVHDYAIVTVKARLDVTRGCGNLHKLQSRHATENHPGIRTQHRRLYCAPEWRHGLSDDLQRRRSADGRFLRQDRHHHHGPKDSGRHGGNAGGNA